MVNFDYHDYIKEDKKIKNMIKKNGGNINDKITNRQLSDRGISYDDKGKPIMETHKFINYIFSRIIAKENDEGIWFYNLKKNQYDLLAPEQYKKLFFRIIEEASESVWRTSMEKQYIPFFKNKVENFKTNDDEDGLLQFKNGIFDLLDSEKSFHEPSPDYFCKFRIPYDYNEEAECPKFKEFLNDIFDNDEQRIAVIQEIMGVCIYNGKSIQHLIVFLGNGSNGKSLLASVIKNMLGAHNVSAIALDKLSGDKFAKQNLDGKLLNISSETKTEKIYSTADFKALTGGDSVEIEKKFRNSYTTEINCKFITLANEMFQTDDNSDGFYRRLIIVPFDQQYHSLKPDEEREEGKKYQNPFLEDDLLEELPGIFNFALEGFYRIAVNDFNFTYSTACERAKERFKKEHNVVLAFINDCFDITGPESGNKIKSSDLFPHFMEYCRECHYTKQLNNMTRKRFFNIFNNLIDSEQFEISKKKRKDGEYFVGISFKKKD